MVLTDSTAAARRIPSTENDLGDEFLMRFGFTIVWVGWEFDVGRAPIAMRIHAPIATDHGRPITGNVRAEWTVEHARQEFVVDDLAQYDAVDPTGADSTLTACATMLARQLQPVPRAKWQREGPHRDARRRLRAGRRPTR